MKNPAPFQFPLLTFSLLSLLILLPLNEKACLNHESASITEDGESSEIAMFTTHCYRGFIGMKLLKQRVEGLYLEKLEEYPLDDKINISATLIKMGDYEKALPLLEDLVRDYPEEYAVHSNLGTLYELMGNPDSAIVHIKKGIELNPASHKHSEWIHVRILEAKLGLRNDPNWLKKNSLLEYPKKGTELTIVEKEIRLDQAVYQLKTRLPFTPVPDPILSQLCEEMAEFSAWAVSIQEAYILFILAQRFSDDPEKAFQNRIEDMERAWEKAEEVDLIPLNKNCLNWDSSGREWHKDRVFVLGDPDSVFEEWIPETADEHPQMECGYAEWYAEEQKRKRKFRTRLLFGLTALAGFGLLGVGMYFMRNKKSKNQ